MRKNTDKKSGWEEIKNDFNRNYFFCLFAWLLICLLFSKPINQLLGKLGGFLFSPDSTPPKSNEWLLIILLISMYVVRFYFRKRITDFSLRILYLITPLVLWVCLNLLFDLYPSIKFTKSAIFSQVPQIAILLVVWLVELLILILNYFKAEILPRKNESSFITDIALDPNRQKDVLGFEPFAQRIAEEIKTVSSKESVVFGINGEWGEGKTSMINLIRKQLKDDNYTVVDFHPWKTNSGKAMNQLFFDALKDGLKNKIWGINWKIDRYADALLQLDKTGIGKVIWQFISQPDSVEKQKKRLAESMKLLDKNLVVVVDDLDRLAKNEIADVLKLMRDTANFPNLVFLAAYDRAYLNKAIESEISGHNYESYMDKIVLWEAPIYKPQPRKYLKKLKNYLTSYETIIKNEDIDDLFHEREGIFSKKTSNGLDLFELHTVLFMNLRFVKRFVNFLIFNYKAVVFENENSANAKVRFKDFYYLYLLRFFYAKYYDRFQNAYHELYTWTKAGVIETSNDKYWPIVFSENEQTQNNETVNPKDVENIKTIISQLLISDHRNLPSSRIVWYKNFFDYFHLGNHEDITMEAFAKMLEAEDFETFKNKIEICDVEKKILAQFNAGEIISALRINSEPNPSENEFFTNYFKQLLWVYKTIKDRCPVDLVYNEIQEYLPGRSDLLKDKDINIIQNNVLEFILKEGIEDTIQPILNLMIHKFKEEDNSEKSVGQKVNINTFINIEEVFSRAKSNFLKHTENTTAITLETIRLYYYCYQKTDLTDEIEVIRQMRKLADKYPNNIIKYLINKYSLSSSEETISESYSWTYFLLKIFNDKNDLELFLRNKPLDERRNTLLKYTKYADVDLVEEGDLVRINFEKSEKNLFNDSYTMKQLQDISIN